MGAASDYHPQLYITCYLVVKVSVLVWQVDKKEVTKNKLIPTGRSNPIAETYIP